VILPGVSHFAAIQDPPLFARAVLDELTAPWTTERAGGARVPPQRAASPYARVGGESCGLLVTASQNRPLRLKPLPRHHHRCRPRGTAVRHREVQLTTAPMN